MIETPRPPTDGTHVELSFRVRENTHYIAPDGKLVRPLPQAFSDPATIVALYRARDFLERESA